MERRRTAVDLGGGRVRHRVVLENTPVPYGDLSRRQLGEMLTLLGSMPDLLRAGPGWQPDQVRLWWDKEEGRWVAEIEEEEEAI